MNFILFLAYYEYFKIIKFINSYAFEWNIKNKFIIYKLHNLINKLIHKLFMIFIYKYKRLLLFELFYLI